MADTKSGLTSLHGNNKRRSLFGDVMKYKDYTYFRKIVPSVYNKHMGKNTKAMDCIYKCRYSTKHGGNYRVCGIYDVIKHEWHKPYSEYVVNVSEMTELSDEEAFLEIL